jgi:4-diphosphocytidyl-2-C-methyl-D-erythritol kinase
MRETARAKINLALHVREREPDGYHRIETIFAFAKDGDELRVAPGAEITLALEGPFAGALAGEADNLVLRAARSLRARYGVTAGAALTLDKRLPVASGIGGGSADAGAALRLLNRWWRLGASEQALLELARPLGADVPACLLSRTVRGDGRGDGLTSAGLGRFAGAALLLVNPGVPVSTAQVFAAWSGVDGGPLPERIEAARNDLEAAAVAAAPAIATVLDRLGAADGAMLVRMSGSGATCFALFEDERRRNEAARRIAREHPAWWQLASRLA